MRRVIAALTVVVVIVAASPAAAEPEPPTEVTAPAVCRDNADPPNELTLAPGSMILTGAAWANLDTRVRGLQEDRTRLTAENQSLRESAAAGGFPSWWWIAAGVAAGAAAGFWAGRL